MDLMQELERAIPAGPPLPPPESRTARGRSALRRRRALQGVVGVGAVVALVVPVALASGGPVSQGHDPAPPATRPSTPTGSQGADSPTGRERSRVTLHEDASYRWHRGEVAAVDFPNRRAIIRPGATVLEQREGLFPGKDTTTVALVARWRGEHYWALLEWNEGGATSDYARARDNAFADFEAFVDDYVSRGGLTQGDPVAPAPTVDSPTPTLVDVTWTGDRFRAGGRTTILEQRRDPELPSAFAEPGATTGAAYVERRGVRSLVLYRDNGEGEPQVISVEATGHGDDLGELLAWARERYRSGAGLL